MNTNHIPTEDMLREICKRLDAIEAKLRSKKKVRLSPADEKDLAALYPLVKLDHHFMVRELLDHARLPTEAALRDTLSRIGHSKRIGRLLRRGAGAVLGGRYAECIGKHKSACLWVVKTESKSSQK